MLGTTFISTAAALSVSAGSLGTVSVQPVQMAVNSRTLYANQAATLVAAAIQADWETDASDLREHIDLDSVFVCPPNGYITEVWGNGVYTDGSSVCSAAVHAGLITPTKGGAVTIRTRPGQNGYGGTTRNGVASSDYGAWLGSFIFLDSNSPTDTTIGWDYSVTDLRGRLDQSFSFVCTPNGSVHNVWGSDLYTDDSSVCSAAVHAGLINPRNGGPISIRMISGQGAYTSTSRNGVSTIGYGKWHGSFMFLR